MRLMGYSYNQIAKQIPCAKSTVCYYLGTNQKEKTQNRMKNFRKNAHPYLVKANRFKESLPLTTIKVLSNRSTRRKLTDKIFDFCKTFQNGKLMTDKINFTVDDLIQKFGENPTCYLTGQPINIHKPRSYHFDHIIPRSRGGSSSIDNLGICTKEANLAKSDKTPDELIHFCKRVLEHQGYEISSERNRNRTDTGFEAGTT